MMNVSTAVFLGDFSVERTTLLAGVPLEAETGAFLRRVTILAAPMDGDPTAHWVLRIGTLSQTGFSALAAVTFSAGFSVTPRVVSFAPELAIAAGATLAVRLTPTSGAASPITGLSIIPEFALTGARAR